MGTLNTIENTSQPAIESKNGVLSNKRSMITRFFDLLDGHTESQGKYVDSFFSQGEKKDKIEEATKKEMGDFLSICSHREFYEFLEGSPGLQTAFLYKFKDRVKYSKNKQYDYVGEFGVIKSPDAGATADKFKITLEDSNYYKGQMELFNIKEYFRIKEYLQIEE